MKKLFTLKAVITMLLFVAGLTNASAGARWIGNSYINVNGTWYQASGNDIWATGGKFHNHNLGEVLSLTIGGQIQVNADNNENWDNGTCPMNYKIDGDSGAEGWTEHLLSKYSYNNNNMYYQSGGGNFTSLTIDISGFTPGEHTLRIYFGPLDYNYDSNNSANYVATFTIPSPQNVEVTSAGYATYVSSYPLDFTDAGIKAYTAKVNTSNGKVELTQINKVPANEAVVLYKEGGDRENIPVCLTTTDTPAANDLVAGDGGQVATSAEGYYNYILNDVNGIIGFYKANNQTVASNRAYLHTTFNVAASTARLTMAFADEATGITASSLETVSANRYFDLQGRSVAQPTKGLYIVNGKKTIIK